MIASPLRSLFNKLARLSNRIDAIEFAMPAIFAIVLLVAGPLLAASYFISTHHYLAALVIAGSWFLIAIALIRDLRRGRFGWISGASVCIWLIATVVVWLKVESL